MVRVAGLTPLAVALKVIAPGLVEVLRIAVAAPENSFILGSWKLRSDVASPFAPASYVPSPVTVKLTILSAVGTMLPSLSATCTVTYTSSSPSAMAVVRLGVSTK